jgi:hypothetical protein
MTPYLDRGSFVQLKESALFAKTSVANGTVVWPGDIDIAPETLYQSAMNTFSR